MSCGLDALKEYRCQQQGVNVYADGYLDIIEKELKALEIIKEKQVDIHNLLNSKTCEQYNGFTHWLGCKANLTQEEYDLLKEVLL